MIVLRFPKEMVIFVPMRKFLLSVIASISLFGCAVQSQPEGGPRDLTPPVLLEQFPALGTLHFSGNKATMLFDEYIQTSDLKAALTSSPELPGLTFTTQGKRLVFDWDEAVQMRDNTTYRISLGEGVGDLNENNKASNLEFVWSTGNDLDSMSLNGVVQAASTTSLDGLHVWLVPANTDTLVSPLFACKPKKDGSFSFAYLPEQFFDLIVFEDLNFNKKWDESEPMGFRKSYFAKDDTASVELMLFNEFYKEPIALDTSFSDSIAAVMDTVSLENIGQLSLVVPDHDISILGYLQHESGWILPLDLAPSSDTVTVNLGRQLPGKYSFFGFFDEDADKTWTPASWYQNRASEVLVAPFTFELKANWELAQPLPLK
jgi:hypothetical protein